jgi:peptidylprolyl isomerase domain and WD repeat-containing protein 1
MKAPVAIIIAILIILPLAALGFSMNNSPSNNSTAATTATPKPTYVDPADVVSATKVKLSTDKGDIIIDLYPQDAPMTVKNFVTLGNRGFYNNIIFHRVIKDFMIQTGDPQGNGTGGTSIYGPTFPDEINSHKIVVGTVAMANRGKDTNSSQFFIVTEQAQPTLDGSYTAFGQVDDAASMSVVRAIAAVPTDSSDRPTGTPPKITGFTILDK